MFKKIISNLAFSPAIVGQLGFYAKRLKKEEISRRTGLIFVALSLVVQMLAIIQPPVSANAQSPNDLVRGGLKGSLSTFLRAYDADPKLKAVINYAGITRAEVSAASRTTFSPKYRLSWGYLPKFSYAQGERKHVIKNSNGQVITTVYSRPLSLWTGANAHVSGWVGRSAKMGWFAIMNSCGNLVTEKVPSPPIPETPNISRTKSATNTSQGFVKASDVKAVASDQISFTVSATNNGAETQSVELIDPLLDTLEYARLVDGGGGTLNDTTKVLSWPTISLASKETQTRTFVVRLLESIPTMPEGSSEPTSFDCTIINTFGNSVSIMVDCPTPKVIEKVVKELPKTGPTENIIFAGIVFGVATYFYTRSRLLEKETRLIRKQVSVGAL